MSMSDPLTVHTPIFRSDIRPFPEMEATLIDTEQNNSFVNKKKGSVTFNFS